MILTLRFCAGFGSVLDRMQNKMRAKRILETTHLYKEFLFPVNRYFALSLSFSVRDKRTNSRERFNQVSRELRELTSELAVSSALLLFYRADIRWKRVYFIELFKRFSRGGVRATSRARFPFREISSMENRSIFSLYSLCNRFVYMSCLQFIFDREWIILRL